MKKVYAGALSVLCVLMLRCVATADEPRIVSFGKMYGVDGPFRGATNAIRGIAGDDLAWSVDHFVRGWLTTKGKVHIVVRGLVFKEGPLTGTNDEANFRAVVSCLTESGNTTPVANVATAGFPASTSGNSTINESIELPNPCVAPIIFITGEDPNKWFAVTGFEKEE
jgi:hypothetical protein